MIIYPFKCPICGLHQEILRHYQNASDPAYCNHCNSQLERIFTPIAAHIRGTSNPCPAGAIAVGNEYDTVRNVSNRSSEIEISNEERHQMFAESPELAALPD